MALVASWSSCQRQELEDKSLLLAYIPISMDWSESLMPDGYMANVSIVFYPIDGGTPTVCISDDLEFKVVSLPLGEYSVLVHNDIESNIGGVSFSDYNSFNDANIQVSNQSSTGILYYYPSDNEQVSTIHDRAASWSLDYFNVNTEMITYTRSTEFSAIIAQAKASTYMRNASRLASKSTGEESRSDDGEDDDWNFYDDSTAPSDITRMLELVEDIVPQPLTAPLSIEIQVENLNNATSVEGVLRGTAHGKTLSGGSSFKSSDNDNLYCWTFEDFSYDDDTYINGRIYYDLNTMGRTYESGESYELELFFALQSGEVMTITRDITDEIVDAIDITGSVTAEIEIKLDLDDTKVTLPDALDAGFGVSGWGESEVVYL